MIELLPCPFCGSKNLTKHNKAFGAIVSCNDCDARGPGVYRSWENEWEYNQKNIDIAGKKWNMRISNQERNQQ